MQFKHLKEGDLFTIPDSGASELTLWRKSVTHEIDAWAYGHPYIQSGSLVLLPTHAGRVFNPDQSVQKIASCV